MSLRLVEVALCYLQKDPSMGEPADRLLALIENVHCILACRMQESVFYLCACMVVGCFCFFGWFVFCFVFLVL